MIAARVSRIPCDSVALLNRTIKSLACKRANSNEIVYEAVILQQISKRSKVSSPIIISSLAMKIIEENLDFEDCFKWHLDLFLCICDYKYL